MLNGISKEAISKMESSCETFKIDLKSLRTGRASASILDGIIVPVGNNNMRLNHIANINVAGNNVLNVNVWNSSHAPAVNKAITNSDLGFTPVLEGSVIRINIPELSEESRRNLVKTADGYAERIKIAIRNIRRETITKIKDLHKSKSISEDEYHREVGNVQKITEKKEKEVDILLKNKRNEILGE